MSTPKFMVLIAVLLIIDADIVTGQPGKDGGPLTKMAFALLLGALLLAMFGNRKPKV